MIDNHKLQYFLSEYRLLQLEIILGFIYDSRKIGVFKYHDISKMTYVDIKTYYNMVFFSCLDYVCTSHIVDCTSNFYDMGYKER